MLVTKIGMLRWMLGLNIEKKIRNVFIHKHLEVVLIMEKMMEISQNNMDFTKGDLYMHWSGMLSQFKLVLQREVEEKWRSFARNNRKNLMFLV